LGQQHDPNEWRLFIDSSNVSLKAVLLHIGNERPTVPIGHAVNMKETYDTLKQLLDHIEYDKYGWYICGVIALLVGLQLGYTKHCCFICEWNSRARDRHYVQKHWPRRQALIPGQKHAANEPLVDDNKVFLPPLHIKL